MRKFLAWVLTCFAVAALGADLLVLLENGGYRPLSLGEIWRHLDPDSYISTAGLLASRLPSLWEPVIVTLLACPAWLLLAGLALVCFMRGAGAGSARARRYSGL